MLDFDMIKGRHFAFTGKLQRFTRKQAKQLVSLLGGETDDTVKKETNYLIVGKIRLTNGSDDGKTIKYRRAESLKTQGKSIKLLSEQEFYDLLKESI